VAQVIYVDLRDHGRSARHDPADWSLEVCADDLRAFCDELRAKGVRFPVALKEGVGGRLLCYVAAPDGVSIELMQGRLPRL